MLKKKNYATKASSINSKYFYLLPHIILHSSKKHTQFVTHYKLWSSCIRSEHVTTWDSKGMGTCIRAHIGATRKTNGELDFWNLPWYLHEKKKATNNYKLFRYLISIMHQTSNCKKNLTRKAAMYWISNPFSKHTNHSNFNPTWLCINDSTKTDHKKQLFFD